MRIGYISAYRRSSSYAIEATKDIPSLYVLPENADGMFRLNGICMCLLVVGEELKKIDKQTIKQIISDLL